MSGKPKERTREKDGRGSILPCQPKALRGRWQRIKECGSKAIKVSLVIALALSALGLSTCALGKAAYAADSAHLTVGSKISYGGYATTWMEADGTMAYCGNPSALTPPAGSYAKHMIDAPPDAIRRRLPTSGSATAARVSSAASGLTLGTTGVP